VLRPLIWFERRLGGLVAAYFTLLILVLTLAPFVFRWPVRPVLVGFATVSDLVANVALFLPLGFALGLDARWKPAVVGFGLSVAIEVIQQFVPGRNPSLLDVVTNTLGAWLGVELYHLVRTSLTARAHRVGVLALDLPLMGLFYLLTPLLWLTGLSAGAEPVRRALAALVGVAGALILGAIDRHHLRARGVPPWVAPGVAGGWFAIGLLPGWFADPGYLLSGAFLVAAAAYLCASRLAAVERYGARYEVPTLRQVALPLGAHLLLAAGWPFRPRLALGIGLGGGHAVGRLDTAGLLTSLELIAACTVVGYALAEVRGRVREPVRWSRAIVLGQAISVAVALTALRAFNAWLGASLIEALLYAAATYFGALLYTRQRDYVRALLGRKTPRPHSLPGYGRIGAPLPLGDGAP